jgi:ribosome-binding factor A
MAGVKRATRVARRLQEELSAALRELRDPRLAGVLVSRVEVTDDLQSARVYVRREPRHDGAAAFGPSGEQGGDAPEVKAALKALGAAAGRLRRAVGQALVLRHVPELRFFYDESLDAVTRIEELLREVKRDAG